MLGQIDPRLTSRLDADAKYDIYVERQRRDIERQKQDEKLEIPTGFDFEAVLGLSNEAKAKFRQHQPPTIGHAGRIEGITPAALVLLSAHARRHRSDTM